MDTRWLWLSGLAVAVMFLMGVAAWRTVRTQGAETRSLAGRIGRLPWRGKGRLAWALLRDRRIPLWIRAMIPALILYLAVPIDIIPDFIPILGHLDDIAVALVAGGVLLRFTPRHVLEDHVERLEAG